MLCAALLTALAWPAHEIFVHHDADNDCQVCAVTCSPELNADCGSLLLAAPENFELAAPICFVKSVPALPLPAFQGRAPPIA